MRLTHILGYGLLRCVVFFFGALPVRQASFVGGWIGRTLGPLTRFHKIARRNLDLCLPHADHAKILHGMWDNLGRTVAEYAHLETIALHHTTIHDPHHVLASIQKTGGFCISGHIANWETLTLAPLLKHHLIMHAVYRAPNNKWVDAWLKRLRSFNGRIQLFNKTRKGALEVMRALSQNECVGVLIDQKDNTGRKLKFFNLPANTNVSFAEMMLRTNKPALIGVCIRSKDCEFDLHIQALDTGGSAEDIAQRALAFLEAHIRQYPDQFLWIHRRFDKAFYAANTASSSPLDSNA